MDMQELQKIKIISDNINAADRQLKRQNPYCPFDVNSESYFRKVDPKEMRIVPYDANSAVEWKEQLNMLWEDEPFKKDFVLPVVVALLKNQRKVIKEKKVSAYIYEF